MRDGQESVYVSIASAIVHATFSSGLCKLALVEKSWSKKRSLCVCVCVCVFCVWMWVGGCVCVVLYVCMSLCCFSESICMSTRCFFFCLSTRSTILCVVALFQAYYWL
jgi:hypothetical protein